MYIVYILCIHIYMFNLYYIICMYIIHTRYTVYDSLRYSSASRRPVSTAAGGGGCGGRAGWRTMRIYDDDEYNDRGRNRRRRRRCRSRPIGAFSSAPPSTPARPPTRPLPPPPPRVPGTAKPLSRPSCCSRLARTYTHCTPHTHGRTSVRSVPAQGYNL